MTTSIWLQIVTIACSIGTPILVGIVMFNKNRDKEFTMKQGDVAGDLYESMFVYHSKTVELLRERYEYAKTQQIVTFLKENKDKSYLHKNAEQYEKILNEIENKLAVTTEETDSSFNKLFRNIGIFRFYLFKKEKDILDKATDNFPSAYTTNLKFPYIEVEDKNQLETVYYQLSNDAIENFDIEYRKFTSVLEKVIDGEKP